jgi:hypothetical protein
MTDAVVSRKKLIWLNSYNSFGLRAQPALEKEKNRTRERMILSKPHGREALKVSGMYKGLQAGEKW